MTAPTATDLRLRKLLGRAQLIADHLENALSIYAGLARDYPADADMLVAWGDFYLAAGDAAKARALYTRALPLSGRRSALGYRLRLAEDECAAAIGSSEAGQGGLRVEDPEALTYLLERLTGRRQRVEPAALGRAAAVLQAVASSPPVLREPLRGEVEQLVADLKLSPFAEALQRFAERCDTPAIRAFAAHATHQLALGMTLPDLLAAEEAHVLAMARQGARQRIQRSAIVMAAVTVILLCNGLLVYFTPVLYDLTRFLAKP
jgi:hypothetical protein